MLEGTPEPGEGEMIVKVTALRGGNLLDVANEHGEEALCMLPAKFRNLVWIKRGNFVLATYSGEDFETSAGTKGKVKYTVKHILFKTQIDHLVKQGLWPAGFTDSIKETEEQEGTENQESGGDGSDSEDDLFVNTNRRGAAYVSSSDESTEEEEDDDDDDVEEEEQEQGQEEGGSVVGKGEGENTGDKQQDPVVAHVKEDETQKASSEVEPPCPPPTVSTFKVLSFDLDDTIWECGPVIRRTVQKVHEHISSEFPELLEVIPDAKAYDSFLSEAKVLARKVGKDHDFSYMRHEVHRLIAERANIEPERIKENLFEVYISERSKVIDHVYPGVIPALETLKAKGYTLVSLTNGNCDMERVPELYELFDHHISAISAGAAKPHPLPFQHVVEVTGVEGPHEVLHIGDSISCDVKGASDYGMHTVWVNRSEKEGVDHGADFVVRCVVDLPAIL